MAHLPWADAVATGRKSYSGPGTYDLCPRCKKRKKRETSARCQVCANKYRAIQNHVRQLVQSVYRRRVGVRFEFMDGRKTDNDADLYDTVTIEWTCRYEWCGKVFSTEHYTDEWVMMDAQAVCPRCGSKLVLKHCAARLLGVEVDDG